jgi:hypothetical protein
MMVRLTEVADYLKADPPRRRLAIGAVVVTLVVVGGWLIKELAGDALIGAINHWLIQSVGPLLPAIGEAVATYVVSIVAAAGLLWFAFSMGYSRGL